MGVPSSTWFTSPESEEYPVSGSSSFPVLPSQSSVVLGGASSGENVDEVGMPVDAVTGVDDKSDSSKYLAEAILFFVWT